MHPLTLQVFFSTVGVFWDRLLEDHFRVYLLPAIMSGHSEFYHAALPDTINRVCRNFLHKCLLDVLTTLLLLISFYVISCPISFSKPKMFDVSDKKSVSAPLNNITLLGTTPLLCNIFIELFFDYSGHKSNFSVILTEKEKVSLSEFMIYFAVAKFSASN